jgi:hypothetical protein
MPRFEGVLEGARPFVPITFWPGMSQRAATGEPSLQGLALVDTGSDASGITQLAAERLSLVTNVMCPIATVLGEREVPAYSVRLQIMFNIPSAEDSRLHELEVFEDQSKWWPQMSGMEVVGLLGMDVLRHCRLSLDGPSDKFEIIV